MSESWYYKYLHDQTYSYRLRSEIKRSCNSETNKYLRLQTAIY